MSLCRLLCRMRLSSSARKMIGKAACVLLPYIRGKKQPQTSLCVVCCQFTPATVPTMALLQSIWSPTRGPAETGVGWKTGCLKDAGMTGTLPASLPCQALAGSSTLGWMAMGWGSRPAIVWFVQRKVLTNRPGVLAWIAKRGCHV